MIPLNHLKEIARAATPGEWRHIPGDSYCAYPHVQLGGRNHILFEDHSENDCAGKHCDNGAPSSESDAQFIATFSPQTVLALLECVEALAYYGDFMNYSVDYDTSGNGFSRRCILYGDIEERNEVSGLGGLRARDALEKLEKEVGK